MTQTDFKKMLRKVAEMTAYLKESTRRIREDAKHVGTVADHLSAAPVRPLPAMPAPRTGPTDDPKLLTLPQVCQRVGLGRSKIYGLIKTGGFPRPVKIGSVSRWATRQVDAWVEQQIAGPS